MKLVPGKIDRQTKGIETGSECLLLLKDGNRLVGIYYCGNIV